MSNLSTYSYPGMEMLRPAQQFGPYRIEQVIGQGAVAVVYQARQMNGRVVALKVLMPAAAREPHMRQLFQHEYQILARLRHPGVIEVYDAGQIDSKPYIAMPLIQGITLEEFLVDNEKPGEAASLEIARQVANTLDYVHSQGIVHRDLKPGNLFVASNRRIILFDFGAALDQQGPAEVERQGIYGTPSFVAPEQIRQDGTVDGRADLYALGVILYRMLTGRKPFYGSRAEVLHAHLHQPPPKPSDFSYVSPQVEALVLKALAKDPADRFQSGQDFEQALSTVQIEAPPEPASLPQRILGWLGRG
jgi:serine/threonine-protein kinase